MKKRKFCDNIHFLQDQVCKADVASSGFPDTEVMYQIAKFINDVDSKIDRFIDPEGRRLLASLWAAPASSRFGRARGGPSSGAMAKAAGFPS